MKIKEIRELSSEELEQRARELRHEKVNLRVQQQNGQLENPARINLSRKELAQIETILSERRQKAAAAGG
jgi:large subunit ribosomal protein L29